MSAFNKIDEFLRVTCFELWWRTTKEGKEAPRRKTTTIGLSTEHRMFPVSTAISSRSNYCTKLLSFRYSESLFRFRFYRLLLFHLLLICVQYLPYSFLRLHILAYTPINTRHLSNGQVTLPVIVHHAFLVTWRRHFVEKVRQDLRLYFSHVESRRSILVPTEKVHCVELFVVPDFTR